jgi:hypothetical protein
VRPVEVHFLEELLRALRQNGLVLPCQIPRDYSHAQVLPRLPYVGGEGSWPPNVKQRHEHLEPVDRGEHELEPPGFLGGRVVESEGNRAVIHQTPFHIRDRLVIENHICVQPLFNTPIFCLGNGNPEINPLVPINNRLKLHVLFIRCLDLLLQLCFDGLGHSTLALAGVDFR